MDKYCCPYSLDPMKILIHSLSNFRVFLVSKTSLCAIAFSVELPTFRYFLTLTRSFHFYDLQSANNRFSVDSKSVIKAY